MHIGVFFVSKKYCIQNFKIDNVFHLFAGLIWGINISMAYIYVNGR